ncbi:hypothetical protein M5689_008341 [Euphorbia peplus]|nr:hypothetical protein M5689_008341 [Euphorbia peplus]
MEEEIGDVKTASQLTREIEKKIVKRVKKILEKENLYQTTEKKIREKAAEDLGINLSDEPFKAVVSRTVAEFLEELDNRVKKN